MPGIIIFFLHTLVMENLENFQHNTDAYNLHTRCKCNVHIPNANLIRYQGELYHTRIKLFGNLPRTTISLNHDTQV
jgi:hypothetical protein